MKNLLYAILVCSIVLISCGPSNMTIFNNTISESLDKVQNVQIDFDDLLVKSFEEEKFDDLSIATDSTLTKLNAELGIIKALETPDEGQKFKESAVKVIESIINYVELGIKAKNFEENISKEQFEEFQKERKNKLDTIKVRFGEMQKVQVEFASKTGMELK